MSKRLCTIAKRQLTTAAESKIVPSTFFLPISQQYAVYAPPTLYIAPPPLPPPRPRSTKRTTTLKISFKDRRTQKADNTIATGKCIDVIRSTLPEFLSNGLGDSSIFADDIRLKYRKGGASSWSITQGRKSYIAASEALRLFLIGAFSDAEILIDKFRFVNQPSQEQQNQETLFDLPQPAYPEPFQEEEPSFSPQLWVRMTIRGLTRFTGHETTITCLSRYEFSSETGLVNKHIIEALQPVIGPRLAARQAAVDGHVSMVAVYSSQWEGH